MSRGKLAPCQHHVRTVLLQSRAFPEGKKSRVCGRGSVTYLPASPCRSFRYVSLVLGGGSSSGAELRGGGAGGRLRRLDFFHLQNQSAAVGRQVRHGTIITFPVTDFKIRAGIAKRSRDWAGWLPQSFPSRTKIK